TSCFYPFTVHPDPHSFPTRRSSDLRPPRGRGAIVRAFPRAVPGASDGLRPAQTGFPDRFERLAGASVLPPCRAVPFRQFLVFSRSEEHTSELQSRENLVCRLLLEKK